jgi:hypothetical protein
VSELTHLLAAEKPIALIFVNPACPACPALFPLLGAWQRTHGSALTIVIVAAGDKTAIAEITAQHQLVNVFVEHVPHEVLELFRMGGIPSAITIRPDGTMGSTPAIGLDRIRSLVLAQAQGQRS